MRLFALLLIIHVTGCVSYIPFAHDVRVKNNLRREHLACLQYYLSDEIVIERDVTYNDAQVSGGELKTVGKRIKHEVTFVKGAPGVAVLDTIGRNQVGVRFDPQQATPLIFRRLPAADNIYLIDLDQRRKARPDLFYASYRYEVVKGKYAYLRIEKDATDRESSREDTFSGETLDPKNVPTTARMGNARPPPVRFKRINDECVKQRLKELRPRRGRAHTSRDQPPT